MRDSEIVDYLASKPLDYKLQEIGGELLRHREGMEKSAEYNCERIEEIREMLSKHFGRPVLDSQVVNFVRLALSGSTRGVQVVMWNEGVPESVGMYLACTLQGVVTEVEYAHEQWWDTHGHRIDAQYWAELPKGPK